MIGRSILLGLILTGTLSLVSGQGIPNQGIPDRVSQLKLLSDYYQKATGSNLLFLNGSLYREEYPQAQGHPFFGNGSWSEGTLWTGGQAYEGLLIKYDIYNDLLIYNYFHETGTYQVSLDTEKVEQFELAGHHFVRLRPDGYGYEGQVSEYSADDGFFEEICRGEASLYLKRLKRYDPPSSTGNGRFLELEQVYILQGGRLSQVRGKRGILRALHDQEKAIKKYIRERNIVFRHGDIKGYQQVVEFYNAMQP